MKKVSTSGLHTLKIIPREYTTLLNVELRDDSTNETTTLSFFPSVWNKANFKWNEATFKWNSRAQAFINGDYIDLAFFYTFIEGRFYDITIYDNSIPGVEPEVIYIDKLFCTNQDVDQEVNDYYSVNDGVYTTYNSGDDNYIIL